MPHPDAGFDERLAKVRSIIVGHGLSSLVIRRNPNIAWFIAGRAHVPSTIDTSCLDIVVTQTEVIAVTNSIEAPRLKDEELPNSIRIEQIEWWESRDGKLPTGRLIGTDLPGGDRTDVSVELENARQSLTSFDRDRFLKISVDAAIALGNAMKLATRNDREIDVAGRISQALWEKDLEISFIGVAGSERVMKYRHPLPTSSLVGSRVVASICAKRKGLIASVTRIVTFDPLSDEHEKEYSGLLNVERGLLDATKVGETFGQVMRTVTTTYGENGYESDEWKRHHQGGPTGYLPRDWPATLVQERTIALNQPIAWNPTGKGWKLEDTWLTTSDGVRLCTSDPQWPNREVGGRFRPDLLRR